MRIRYYNQETGIVMNEAQMEKECRNRYKIDSRKLGVNRAKYHSIYHKASIPDSVDDIVRNLNEALYKRSLGKMSDLEVALGVLEDASTVYMVIRDDYRRMMGECQKGDPFDRTNRDRNGNTFISRYIRRKSTERLDDWKSTEHIESLIAKHRRNTVDIIEEEMG